jgi:predicted MPP superfamily phosphohydrolase
MPLFLVAALAVYQVLLFFVHAAVYETLVIIFGWHPVWTAWLFGVLSISLVTASIAVHKSKSRTAVWYYRISAYWFGLVHFLFIGTFFFYIAEVILYHYNDYIPPGLLGSVTLAILFIIHTYATWQTTRPKTTRISVALPNLPAFWRGKKVIFVSDLHLGAIWNASLVKKIVAVLRAEAPESVWIGGDMFDGVRCDPESALRPFIELHPPEGVYFVTGNHEYVGDTKSFLSAIRGVGIHILNNEKIDLQGLQLIGLDWKATHKAEDCRKILERAEIDRDRPSVLLKHEPNDLAVSASAGVSLQLSGHTHAGQIFPLTLFTHQVYRGFDYGLKRFRDMMIFTSSGVGAWGPPLRLGTKSEILIITFL